jgi:hypothetical protein
MHLILFYNMIVFTFRRIYIMGKQRKNGLVLFLLAILLLLTSCARKISQPDIVKSTPEKIISGVWMDSSSTDNPEGKASQMFSWGEGYYHPNESYIIDAGNNNPYFIPETDRYSIKSISQSGNLITVVARLDSLSSENKICVFEVLEDGRVKFRKDLSNNALFPEYMTKLSGPK